jgi:hypothetical protein
VCVSKPTRVARSQPATTQTSNSIKRINIAGIMHAVGA